MNGVKIGDDKRKGDFILKVADGEPDWGGGGREAKTGKGSQAPSVFS